MRKILKYNLPKLETTTIDGRRHYTTPEGNIYPSVTTVCSLHDEDAIKKWKEKVGAEEAKKITGKAANKGTKHHTLCENYLLGKPLEFETPVQQENFSLIKPKLDLIGDIHALEKPLYSNHLKVAGRVDTIAPYSNKLSIIDYKTANHTKKEEWVIGYFLQTSFYAVAWEELTGEPVSQLVLIIAVDQDDPQVFIEKRDNWIGKAIELRKKYFDKYGR